MMPIWRKWPIDELRQAKAEIEAELARRGAQPAPTVPDAPPASLSGRLRFMAAITAGGEISNLTHLSVKLMEAAADAAKLEERHSDIRRSAE